MQWHFSYVCNFDNDIAILLSIMRGTPCNHIKIGVPRIPLRFINVVI